MVDFASRFDASSDPAGDPQDYLKQQQAFARQGLYPAAETRNVGGQGGPAPQKPNLSPQSTDNLGGGPPPYPAQPTLQDIPKAPEQQFQDSLNVFKDPAIVLAGLGSLFTRRPLTTAMNAAAGAMDGYRQGQEDTFKLKQKEWEDKTKAAIEQNGIELEKYKQAWELREKSVKDSFAKMYALSAGHDDPIMQAAIKSGNTEMVEKIIVGRESAQTKLQSLIQAQEIKNQFAQGDPNAVQEQAAAIAAGKEPPLTGYALRTPYGQNVMAMVSQINPDYDAAKDWYGKLAGARVTGAAIPKADATALTKLVAQRSAVTAFEQTAVKNGEVLLQLADKVDQTGIPVFEKWLRAGRQATGDADVAMFNTQMQLYRNEAAKILTNPNLTGVLSDSARHEIESFLQGGSSAKQLHAVVNLLTKDFDRRTKSIDEQIKVVSDRIKGAADAPAASQPSSGTTSTGIQWSISP